MLCEPLQSEIFLWVTDKCGNRPQELGGTHRTFVSFQMRVHKCASSSQHSLA